MSLQGKRVAILAENNYEDQELWYPYYRLKEAGADKALKRSSVQAETAPTLQRFNGCGGGWQSGNVAYSCGSTGVSAGDHCLS